MEKIICSYLSPTSLIFLKLLFAAILLAPDASATAQNVNVNQELNVGEKKFVAFKFEAPILVKNGKKVDRWVTVPILSAYAYKRHTYRGIGVYTESSLIGVRLDTRSLSETQSNYFKFLFSVKDLPDSIEIKMDFPCHEDQFEKYFNNDNNIVKWVLDLQDIRIAATALSLDKLSESNLVSSIRTETRAAHLQINGKSYNRFTCGEVAPLLR